MQEVVGSSPTSSIPGTPWKWRLSGFSSLLRKRALCLENGHINSMSEPDRLLGGHTRTAVEALWTQDDEQVSESLEAATARRHPADLRADRRSA
jgi:hypothetical protein